MSKNFLFIVEGKKDEKKILESILIRYGFCVYVGAALDFATPAEDIVSTKFNTAQGDSVYIVQGPRNRIHDWLKRLDTESETFDNYFRNLQSQFAGIFIIYDVDHTSKQELEQMFNKYRDETSDGLLLLSSPCIEVLADINRQKDLDTLHLESYKAELNIRFDKSNHCSTRDYIIDHFEELALYYLDKNTTESKTANIMEHPQFVLSEINRLNDRDYIENDNQPVHYRYFTTVLYVCIAYIKGLTREIENADIVKRFLESYL